MKRTIIANCGGFWGDDPGAPRRQVEGGPINYLVMDYLAEVTMAILQKQRARNPAAGFPADVIAHLRDVLAPCVQRGITIITNAGGVNPLACRAAVETLAKELGVADRVKTAIVAGDDLYARLDDIIASGEPLTNMDTGQSLSEIRPRVLSAHAYIGAEGIVAALERGANVIITGRVADAAVTLAPMMFEFGWSPTDWDRVAAGVVAGHIIECGAQATGGNFTDWPLVKSYKRMGFPIVEAQEDGAFVVTKHPNTGGLVSVHTVAEQILYEIGPPGYMTPDVVARFDSIRLEQDGPDRVRVSNARGEPAPSTLKVSISYQAGWRAFGRLAVSGPEALAKAHRVAEAFWEAAGGRGAYDQAIHQFIGWNACHAPLAACEPGEVLVQFAVSDRDERKINSKFAAQIAPRVLGTVPGITYVADQGRPRASEVVAFWPALVSRETVQQHVLMGEDEIVAARAEASVLRAEASVPKAGSSVAQAGSSVAQAFRPAAPEGRAEALRYQENPDDRTIRVSLIRLCLARSGDKGDTANIGVIARSPAIYSWIIEHLTPAFVKRYFDDVCEGEVERFEFPNLMAVNFLLYRSLGGGGAASLLLDAQGKTYAQFLLAAEVEVPESLVHAETRHADQSDERRV